MSGLEAGPSGPASEGRAQGGAFSYDRLPDLPSKKSQFNNGAMVWFSSRTPRAAQPAKSLPPKVNQIVPGNCPTKVCFNPAPAVILYLLRPDLAEKQTNSNKQSCTLSCAAQFKYWRKCRLTCNSSEHICFGEVAS